MQATNSLILKSALLSWIEIQLLHSTAGSIAWIRILENILIVVDSNKIEASTNGEWRSAICRCLEYLLNEKSCRMSLFLFGSDQGLTSFFYQLLLWRIWYTPLLSSYDFHYYQDLRSKICQLFLIMLCIAWTSSKMRSNSVQ